MPIRAEGRYTVSDLWFGSMFHLRKAIMFYGGLGAFMLLVCILLIIADRAAWLNLAIPLGLGSLWIIVWIPVCALYGCNRNLKRTPNLQGLIGFDFTDDGYDVTSTHSTAHINWTALVKWREGKRCFLFYSNPTIAIVIPKHFFQNPADIDSLRFILQGKVLRK